MIIVPNQIAAFMYNAVNVAPIDGKGNAIVPMLKLMVPEESYRKRHHGRGCAFSWGIPANERP